MPLILKKNIEPDAILAVWHIQETHEELLNKIGSNYYEEAHSEKLLKANARHYLASRIILTELFPFEPISLSKNLNNKPSLLIHKKPFSISITHSFDYAGIILSESGELGLDLEKMDERISRVKKKFMSDEELDFAGKEEQVKEQTLIWSAKETLYKLYSRKELDFKKNLRIFPFHFKDSGIIRSSIETEWMIQEIFIQYETIQNYILTYTTDQIKNHAK